MKHENFAPMAGSVKKAGNAGNQIAHVQGAGELLHCARASKLRDAKNMPKKLQINQSWVVGGLERLACLNNLPLLQANINPISTMKWKTLSEWLCITE